MKHKFSIRLAALLLLLPLLTAGCSFPQKEAAGKQQADSGQAQSSGKQAAGAKGRYQEEEIPFPVPIQTIFDLEKKDGKLRILLEPEPGGFCCCTSQDEGATWQQEPWDASWLPEHYRVVSACFAPEGEIFASAGKISENPLDEQHAAGVYSYFRLKETGQGLEPEPFSLELPEPKEEYRSYGLSSIACPKTGTLVGVLQSGVGETLTYQLLGFDTKSGKATWAREVKHAEIKAFGDTLYVNEYDGSIKTLDLASGEEQNDPIHPPKTVFFCQMDVNPEKKKLYTCDKSGIYSSDSTMSFTELLVDGRLSRFSDVSLDIKYFCQVTEKVFLAFLENQSSRETKLLRYQYNADLATQPEQELNVYSLCEDEIIKKLIADFQSSHPDVLVSYGTGTQAPGAKNESDAINILNTELMAGNGPDLLFLNGLPWNAYAKQGVLLDLSGMEILQDGNKVFQNLFLPFEAEGRQFAAPLAFSIPILAGEESQVSQASSLDGLLELVEQADSLPPLGAKNFLPYMFSVFWQEVQEEDGSISREQVTKLLEYAKTLEDLIQPKQEGLWAFFYAVSQEAASEPSCNFAKPEADVWDVVYGNVASSVGYLGSLRDFTAISDHIPGQNLSYQPFPAHVFSPLLAGVNSNSSQPGLAVEFLEFTLGEKEQMVFDGSLSVFSAFPVNKAAWQAMAKEPSPKKMEEYKNVFQQIGGAFQWPGQEEFDRLGQLFTELHTPAMEDPMILRTITDSGNAYLSGNQTLDGAVTEIMQMLELHLAESGY